MTLLLPWLVLFFLCGTARADIAVPPNFQDAFVAQEAGVTGLAFTPDGRMLVAKISGEISIRLEDGTLDNSLALDLRSAVCTTLDRGIQSVAVDPSFETNHYIYVYYESNKNGTCADNVYPNGPVSRLSRFVLNDDDTVDVASEVVLVDNIPSMNLHQGGDLAFGRDGYLYVTTGDGDCDYDGDGCGPLDNASRDMSVLLGKVLRVTVPDGGIPPDNPFTGGNSARCNATGATQPNKFCQETYASGLRNPWKFAFDPNATGTRFFINDVGGDTWEEIDDGLAGADYGWPVREGFCAIGSTTNCGLPPHGMTNPIYAYGHVGGCNSITGGAFVPDGLWRPEDNGAYLYADWGCGTIFELTESSGGGYTSTALVTGVGASTLTDMTFGPYQGGEALYYASYAAGPYVRRLSYTDPRLGPPLSVPLVPGFKQCGTGGNASSGEHAAPLSTPSCSPATTAEAAHLGSQANGVARQNPIAGDPSSPANEADLNFLVWQTDVRSGSETGPDYDPSPSGPDLTLVERLRITDNSNGTGGADRATATDLDFSVPISCTPTIDSRVGSTCMANTTANALMPGAVVEGKQMNIQVFRVRLNDAGVDGVAGNGDDTLFEQEGLVVP
jgi:glucose/arabinose dehydrogenase